MSPNLCSPSTSNGYFKSSSVGRLSLTINVLIFLVKRQVVFSSMNKSAAAFPCFVSKEKLVKVIFKSINIPKCVTNEDFDEVVYLILMIQLMLKTLH